MVTFQHYVAVRTLLVKVKKVRAPFQLAIFAVVAATFICFVGYQISVLNNFPFPIALASPDDLTLRPNAAGTYQEWLTFGAGSSHWDRTSDQDDETGVQVTGSITLKETENLQDATQTEPINSVTAWMRAKAVNGITYYINSTETQYQTTSTTYTDYLTLTFTSVSNAKYFVLGYIEVSLSVTNRQAQAQFVCDSTVLAHYIDRPKVANTEVMVQSFAYIYTGTGNDVTFHWQVSVSGGTLTAKRARIIAIRLDNLNGAEYPSVYQNTEIADVDNVWGDDAGDTFEVTINPSTTAYYLIWASAKVESDYTSSSAAVRLNIDNGAEYIPYLIGGESTWSYARIEDTSTAEEHCFALLAVRQFSAGTHSIKFQIADIDTTPSADWQYISLVAIKLTGVFDFFHASTVTQASTTSTTLQTYTNLNIPSENDGEYLMLGGIVTRGGSTSYDYQTVFTIDGTDYNNQQIRPQDTNDYVPKVFMQNITLNSGSHTVQTRYRTLNSFMTVYVKNSDVVAIRLSSNSKAVILWRTYNMDYESSPITISKTAFTDYSESRTVNPYTGQAWTWSEINSLEIGVRAFTLGLNEIIQVSEFWVTIEYGYNLSLRIMDWDLTDAISEAYVYMNSDVKVSDSNGWANWSLVTGTVQVKVQHYGFWVNGTFSVTMDSDKTIYVRCNLYDVVVNVRESVHNAKLIGVNVTVFNASSVEGNKIKSGITDFNGQVSLTNLPNNTLTFTCYAGSEYTIVMGNTTQQISSEDYSFTVICNQNYVNATGNYTILVYIGCCFFSSPLNGNFKKKLSKRVRTDWKLKGA